MNACLRCQSLFRFFSKTQKSAIMAKHSTPSSFSHPTLGLFHLVPNSRACRFTFRYVEGSFRVTIPPGTTLDELKKCIDSMEPKLLKLRERGEKKETQRFIDKNFNIQSDYYNMSVSEGDVLRPKANLHNGTLQICCPTNTDYRNTALQAWLVRVVEESLRYISKRVLADRLQMLAQIHGFTYAKVSIHKTHGRWGSCSTRGCINLSLYLLLLPAHLRDYVMLHELCHTVEMNHGPRFWAKLNSITNGNAEKLRNEMKRYDTTVFTLSNTSFSL